MRPFEERRWVSRDGLTLSGRDYAGGPGDARLPVICLHGLTRNARDFEEVAPWIAERGRRVLALDVRGRGASARDPDPDHYVPKVYARDVIDQLEALGIGRAVFLGTSMGGIITMLAAAIRPRMVAAAILNDVGPEVAPEGIGRIVGYVGKAPAVSDWQSASDYIRSINKVAFPGYGEAEWEAFARRTFRETGERFELDYDPAIMQPLAQGRYKAPSFIAWQLYRRMARKRPTLVIRGAQSDLLSPTILARMKRQAPGITVVEVPDVGHAPMLTEAAARTAIAGFLDRVD